MRIVRVEITKKNRVNFAAHYLNEKPFGTERLFSGKKFERGSKCKIKITDKSKDLTIGNYLLLVDDSVFGEYSVVDVINEEEEKEKESAGTELVLKHHTYNSKLVESCKKLWGKWCSENKHWIFPSFSKKGVDKLDGIYNSKLVRVTFTYEKDVSVYTYNLEKIGYVVARKNTCNSEVILDDNVKFFKGSIECERSCYTVKEGTVFAIDMPILTISEIGFNKKEDGVSFSLPKHEDALELF